ncbi:VWFA domain-containing protein [Aphelenchoides besseyi]|nr:VWFA domain-containing protein [Aphelenchoides besseyi]
MYTVAAQVRLKIKECVERLFKEIGNDHLRIGIIMHGDYLEDCRPFWSPLYVTKHLPLTTNVQAIVDFVDSAAEIANFTGPECYELVLHEAQAFQWTAGLSHVLVLIGDEVPHEPDENPQHLNWRDELEKLRQMNVVVYGVQARNQEHAKQFYAQCAEKTGGIHLPLAQFNSMVEIIMAVCYHETAQTGRVAQFEREIQAQPGRYNRVIRSVFDRILGRPDSLTNLPGDLHACPVDRFQVLDVGLDTPIRQFVQDQGIQFVSGRGFYEFTKKETIQLYKEIVIMDKQSGDLFEGQYARTLLNLPADQTVKVEPEQLDYIVFVQSTSYNRQLLAGTRQQIKADFR